jgi:hypothetical protein
VQTLSHLEFDIVWEQLGLGEPPYPISVQSFGETVDERAALREATLRDLTERGLHDGRDLHQGLERQLMLLVRNDFSIDGQLSVGRDLRVLAAVRGESGLLVVQTDDEIQLHRMRSGEVLGAVIDLLPEEKPGPGSPVTLPSTLFAEAAEAYAGGGYLGFEVALNRGGVSGRDLRVLGTLVESGRHGGGQLGANSVDQVGRRTRSGVLNWFDTDAGRYIVYNEHRRDGLEWLTFAPGELRRIREKLTELVARVNQ